MPILNETDQVLLESCMDEIRNVVGDTVSEKQLVETIMKHKFDCAKALDVILNYSTETSTRAAGSSSTVKTTTPQSALPMETGNQKPLAISSNTWLGYSTLHQIFFLFLCVYFHAFFGS